MGISPHFPAASPVLTLAPSTSSQTPPFIPSAHFTNVPSLACIDSIRSDVALLILWRSVNFF